MGEAAAFGQYIVGLGKELEAVGPAHLRKAANEAQATILASVRQATGPDLALSHVRAKSGAAGKVGARIIASRDALDPWVVVRATGPLQIVDNPAKAHVIRAKGGTAAQRRKAQKASVQRVLSGGRQYTQATRRVLTPWGPRFAIDHPGHKGKGSWMAGASKAGPRAAIVLSDSYRRTATALGAK